MAVRYFYTYRDGFALAVVTCKTYEEFDEMVSQRGRCTTSQLKFTWDAEKKNPVILGDDFFEPSIALEVDGPGYFMYLRPGRMDENPPFDQVMYGAGMDKKPVSLKVWNSARSWIMHWLAKDNE